MGLRTLAPGRGTSFQTNSKCFYKLLHKMVRTYGNSNLFDPDAQHTLSVANCFRFLHLNMVSYTCEVGKYLVTYAFDMLFIR